MCEKAKKGQGMKCDVSDNEGMSDEPFIYYSEYYYALKNGFTGTVKFPAAT